MKHKELSQIEAEKGFLEDLRGRYNLRKSSSKSLENRLQEINERSDKIGATGRFIPAKTLVKFRGRPVIGTHGIVADFGASATTKLANSLSLLAASFSQESELKERGKIPHKQSNQILITGTVIGSFGFELEEYSPSPQMDIEGTSPVSKAMDSLVEILESSSKDVEDLSDQISEIPKRAIASISDFLESLENNEAYLSLETHNKIFSFRDVEHVSSCLRMLRPENIIDDQEYLSGSFIGILPTQGAFEFRLRNTEEIIRGKFAKPTPDLNDFSKRLLHKEIEILVSTRRIGDSKLRYTIPAEAVVSQF